jgi:beta-lactamase regulating signal transducer with metallopeptidase domain/type II secretory pathway component GspD/PulD (secretin)
MNASDLCQAVAHPDGGFFVPLTLALGHFLWQGCAIAVVYAVAVRLFRRASANVRYCAGVATLSAMAASLPTTLWLLSPTETASATSNTTSPAVTTPAAAVADSASSARTNDEAATLPIMYHAPSASLANDVAEEPSATERIRTMLSDWAPCVGAVYLAGLLAMLLRTGLGLWSGQRLRSDCEPVTRSEILDGLRRNAQRLGLRVVPAIAYCRRVSVPIVVGILRPTILLPLSFASGLTFPQIEAVLSHELAHIRRFDLVVNVFQRLVEAVLFFHPAVWWVSRRVSLERENACDDAVLRLDHQRVQYADALLRLAELCCSNAADRVVLAATAGKSSHFRRRVMRLLGVEEKPTVRLTSFGVLATLAIVASLLLVPLAWRNTANAEAGQPTPAAENVASVASLPRQPVKAEVKPSLAAKPSILTLHTDDVDVRTVLQMLSRESKANIVVSPGTSGRLTMNVQNKTLDDMLALIARVCNLVVRRDGDMIFISTLAEERKTQEDNLPVRIYHLNTVKSGDLIKMLSPLKSPKGRVAASPYDKASPSGGGGRGGSEADSLAGGGSRGGAEAVSMAGGEIIVFQDYEDVLKVIDRVVAACDTRGSLPPLPRNSQKAATSSSVASQPVSIHLDNLDVKKALELLSRETKTNIIVSPGTTGKITVDMRDKPFDEALATIARICNLVVRREGDTISVSTLAEERKAEEDNLPIRLYRLKYVKSRDVLAMVGLLKSRIGKCASLPAADGSEAIVFRDYEDVLKAVDRVIAAIDVQPTQVLIDAVLLEAKPGAVLAAMKELHKEEFVKFVAEVGEDNARKAVVGLDAAIAPGMPPPRLAPAVPNTGMFGWIGQNRDKFLKLLEAKSETRVLAAPRLLVLNKQLAQIELGDLMTKHVPPNTEDGTWKLAFRPFVSSDGHIRLEIALGDQGRAAADAHGVKTKNEDSPARGPQPVATNIIIPPDAPTLVIVPDAVSSKADNPPKKELVMLITAEVLKPQGGDAPAIKLSTKASVGSRVYAEPRPVATPPAVRNDKQARITVSP